MRPYVMRREDASRRDIFAWDGIPPITKFAKTEEAHPIFPILGPMNAPFTNQMRELMRNDAIEPDRLDVRIRIGPIAAATKDAAAECIAGKFFVSLRHRRSLRRGLEQYHSLDFIISIFQAV